MTEESWPPPAVPEDAVTSDDTWITLTMADPDAVSQLESIPLARPAQAVATSVPAPARRERVRSGVIVLAAIAVLAAGGGIAIAARGGESGGSASAPAFTSASSLTTSLPAPTTSVPPVSATVPAPTTTAPTEAPVIVTLPLTEPETTPPPTTPPTVRTTPPPPRTTPAPPRTTPVPRTTPPAPRTTAPPAPSPLSFDQIDEATISARDLPGATVTRGTRITAPCSETEALATVPVRGAGSDADLGALTFGSQPGSFATDVQAKAFIAAVQRTKPCKFTHKNGMSESVTRVETLPPAVPGVTGVRVTYTVDLGGGTTYVGLDGYLAIGRVVGVFSCAGPIENLDEVDQECSTYGGVFGGKLGTAVDTYG